MCDKFFLVTLLSSAFRPYSAASAHSGYVEIQAAWSIRSEASFGGQCNKRLWVLRGNDEPVVSLC